VKWKSGEDGASVSMTRILVMKSCTEAEDERMSDDPSKGELESWVVPDC